MVSELPLLGAQVPSLQRREPVAAEVELREQLLLGQRERVEAVEAVAGEVDGCGVAEEVEKLDGKGLEPVEEFV